MNISIKSVAIIMLVVAIASAALTRYCFPQIQVKTVEKEKDVHHNDIVTVVKVVKEKDGSEETTSTTIDHSTNVLTDNKTTTIMAQPNWMVSASADIKFDDIRPVYAFQIQRRILGPFFVGGNLTTDKYAGVSIGFEF